MIEPADQVFLVDLLDYVIQAGVIVYLFINCFLLKFMDL